MKNRFIATFCLLLLAVSSSVQADRIIIGWTGPETMYGRSTRIFGLDEFDLPVPIPDNMWPAFSDGLGGIRCMDKLTGVDGKFVIGTGYGYLMVRDIYDINWTGAHSYANLTGYNVPVLSVCSRIDGHILAGLDWMERLATYRDYNDVSLAPSGVTNSSLDWMGVAVTAVATLPNGLSVIGYENGMAGLRNPDDMLTDVTGVTTQTTYLSSKVNDIAVDIPTGNIVFALEDGRTATRHWLDLDTPISEFNWSTVEEPNNSVTQVESLTDGKVAIGLKNGYVHLRAVDDLATDPGGVASNYPFSGTYPIDALEVTSNNNILIAVKNNNYETTRNSRITITHGENLQILPVGYNAENPDWNGWLVVDFPVYAIAAVYTAPVPGNCAEAIADGYGLTGDLNSDCRVDFNDIKILAGDWLKCTSPGQPGCEPGYRVITPGTCTVDADLSDWNGANWITLDKPYFQTSPDISEAKFAVRWDNDTNNLYCAVIVNDSNKIFSDEYLDWKGSDRIEIYTQGSAAGGGSFSPDYEIAQQYMIGPNDTTSGSWATFGDGVVNVVSGSGELEYVVDKSTVGQIIYEVGIKQYDTYGGISGANTVVSDLEVGKNIGFDVIVGTRWHEWVDQYDYDYAMLSDNPFIEPGKSASASLFTMYELAGAGSVCGDWGYLSSDIDTNCAINFVDFATLAQDWMLCVEPDDADCQHLWE